MFIKGKLALVFFFKEKIQQSMLPFFDFVCFVLLRDDFSKINNVEIAWN